jgi:hypothetical protein
LSAETQPPGLSFLQELAKLLAMRRGAACCWESAPGVQRLSISAGVRERNFYFENVLLEDPDSEDYRKAVVRVFDVIRRDFERNSEDSSARSVDRVRQVRDSIKTS